MTNQRISFNPIEVPGGPVPLHSPFYVSRPAIEAQLFDELTKPGCLLRLKAPQKMGKSTLMLRLLHQAAVLNYQPLYLDLQLAEHTVLSQPDRFLRWFCAHASRRLGLEPQLDQYWNSQFSSADNCLTYLQTYLLKQVETPVVICLNEVNRIFDYPELAEEFLQLVHLLDQQRTSSASLANLRLVLVYSSELHLSRHPNQPQLNAGVLVELPEFTLGEIQFLSWQYRLDWGTGLQPALALYSKVSGHPYLVQLALHHLATRRANRDVSSSATVLMQLLEQAPTLMGIYSEHLQRLLSVLYTHPELIPTLNQVLQHADSLNLIHADKLQSLGLIKFDDNRAVIRCSLYRQFFSAHLFHQSSLVDVCPQGWF